MEQEILTGVLLLFVAGLGWIIKKIGSTIVAEIRTLRQELDKMEKWLTKIHEKHTNATKRIAQLEYEFRDLRERVDNHLNNH